MSGGYLISKMVRDLVAAGVSGEGIAIAVEALEASEEARKRPARERKQRQRDRENVTGQSRDDSVTVTPPLSPKVPPKVSPKDIYSNPLPTPSPNPKPQPFVLPDDIPKDAWQAYSEMRRKNRKPMTTRAMELAVKRLRDLQAEGHDLTAVLNNSILNGWQGLFAPAGNRTNGKPINLRGSRPDPALDMWRQAHAELAAEDPGEDPGIGFTAWPALPPHGSG